MCSVTQQHDVGVGCRSALNVMVVFGSRGDSAGLEGATVVKLGGRDVKVEEMVWLKGGKPRGGRSRERDTGFKGGPCERR